MSGIQRNSLIHRLSKKSLIPGFGALSIGTCALFVPLFLAGIAAWPLGVAVAGIGAAYVATVGGAKLIENYRVKNHFYEKNNQNSYNMTNELQNQRSVQPFKGNDYLRTPNDRFGITHNKAPNKGALTQNRQTQEERTTSTAYDSNTADITNNAPSVNVNLVNNGTQKTAKNEINSDLSIIMKSSIQKIKEIQREIEDTSLKSPSKWQEIGRLENEEKSNNLYNNLAQYKDRLSTLNNLQFEMRSSLTNTISRMYYECLPQLLDSEMKVSDLENRIPKDTRPKWRELITEYNKASKAIDNEQSFLEGKLSDFNSLINQAMRKHSFKKPKYLVYLKLRVEAIQNASWLKVPSTELGPSSQISLTEPIISRPYLHKKNDVNFPPLPSLETSNVSTPERNKRSRRVSPESEKPKWDPTKMLRGRIDVKGKSNDLHI